MAQPTWTPDPAFAASSRMARLMDRVRRQGVAIDGYDDLWRWSTERPADFWGLVWDDLPIVCSVPPDEVLGPVPPETEVRMRPSGARWFSGARLNFAENLLRRLDDESAPALIARDESGRRRVYSRAELRRDVERFAAFLAARGVVAGDRVVGFLPNREEAVVAMLAATRIGAVWSSCSPDFGRGGVLDRFGQISPTVLITCDGYRYGGRSFDRVSEVREIVSALPSLRSVVWVPVLGAPPPADLPGICSYDAALAECGDEPGPPFAQLPFDHPVYIMYSSGTTGRPKCIVHGAGGTLLQQGKELVYHSDVRPGDAITWFTTTGWMMWNWLVSALLTGARVVLVDGSPAHPDISALWRLAEEEGLTHLGTSPKFLAACEKQGLVPGEVARLGALRSVMSTGSPLAAEQFLWVTRAVGPVQVASICGGTDILGCFMLGSPIDPVYPGEIQRRGLGMAVEAFDASGRPVAGEKGELVCTRPFPSMPVGFFDDPGDEKYLDAYFRQYPGVWRHGDWIEITERGGVVVYGRSDATLNPGGIRIGTAEIYAVVEALPEVADSLAVAQRWRNDDRVVLFVVPAAGVSLDEALIAKIRHEIRTQCTPRHVPAKILAVGDIPRTVSGKKVELAVQRILHGEAVTNRDALANPSALAHFVDRPELSVD